MDKWLKDFKLLNNSSFKILILFLLKEGQHCRVVALTVDGYFSPILTVDG